MNNNVTKKNQIWQNTARIILGAFLIFAGIGHLSFARLEFLAQVPVWVPLDKNLVVVLSGIVEIGLGIMLVSGWKRFIMGWIVAAFFVAVFPGNISQFLMHLD